MFARAPITWPTSGHATPVSAKSRGPVSRILSSESFRIRKGSHSSRSDIAIGLKQPTQRSPTPKGETVRATPQFDKVEFSLPIWPCFGWGLPCRPSRLESPPVGWDRPRRPLRETTPRCALTAPFHPYRPDSRAGGIFSVALSVGLRRLPIRKHPAL